VVLVAVAGVSLVAVGIGAVRAGAELSRPPGCSCSNLGGIWSVGGAMYSEAWT